VTTIQVEDHISYQRPVLNMAPTTINIDYNVETYDLQNGPNYFI